MYLLPGPGYRLPLLLAKTLHLAGPNSRKTVREKLGFDPEDSHKLLGFQDKAGILPRLGCIIKPMLKLGISVS